jgi:apolipoprotein D and lipocalin family protein
MNLPCVAHLATSTPWLTAGLLAGVLLTSGCSSTAPMPTVRSVDLDRFMGDWYVIAAIPTRFERGAHNAVESYRLGDEGRIETTFTFRKGGFDGPEKRYTPTGFVHDRSSNAEWRMQFVWPFKSEYLIVALDPDYSTTIIGRSKRDYLWIMARTPTVPEPTLEELIDTAVALGYERSAIQLIPQRW